MPPVEDMQALSTNLAEATRQNPILRTKGFLAIGGKPVRLVLQGAGPRIETYFDRPLRAEERSGGYLVVIGLKGLDRAAIAGRFGGRI
jgi:cobalamin biosynthesis protein CobW